VVNPWWKLAASVAAICVAAEARASETVTYTYDALGRLVKVEHSGSVNDGLTVQHSYDPAGNRRNVTVTGANSCTNSTPTWGTGTFGCFRWGQ
jgi:YD repeat-containing protein